MEVLDRFARAGIVPVVVLENAEDAVPAARAMLAGGIDVMEITFRTAAAPQAIRAVAESCPDMLVGAGTVLNLEQCKTALAMGPNSSCRRGTASPSWTIAWSGGSRSCRAASPPPRSRPRWQRGCGY